MYPITLNQYDDSYEEYLEFLYEARMMIKNSALSKEEKRQLYKEAINELYKHSLKERYRFLMRLEPLTQ